MKKAAKIGLIIAACLVLIGVIMSGFHWAFRKLATAKYETNAHTIADAYQNITIVADTADIVFAHGENQKTSVVCHEREKLKHAVSVKGDTLTIEVVDTRAWYEHIDIFSSSPKITVYLPQGEYGALSLKTDTGDVEIPQTLQFESTDISGHTGDITSYASVSETAKIKTTTGDIRVENIRAGALDLSVSTGRITAHGITCLGDLRLKVSTGNVNLTDIGCKNLLSDGSTGDISLRNVVATEKFDLERSTGDVKLEDCDAGEIFIETDTGHVTGTLLSSKIFLTETDTGRIDVPKSTTGGRCEISTDTGNIKISVRQP